jgi:CHAT domain-containing protein
LLPPPVDAGLANAERLYLVPTDVLLALPFDVLVTKPVVANQAPRRLVEGPAIVYLDSLSQLAPVRITNANRTPSERLLAFADPISAPVATNNGQPSPGGRAPGNPLARLPALPNSRTEVEAIRDLLDPAHANSRLLTGANATRVELLRLSEHGHAAEYRYLVFATHGLAPGASPGLLEPALVLSPMHPDELLTRSDIYGLDLGADLVSLSACNTAVGEIRPGEGTLGLVRAFRFAGSPAVTATLWPVVDAAAEAMNRRFYYHLAAGVGGAQALRRAKLDLLAGSGISVKQDFSAPRHWAAVVLFGEPPTTVATRPLMQHSAQAPK